MSAVSERTGDVSPVEEALENAAEDENRFVGLNGHLVTLSLCNLVKLLYHVTLLLCYLATFSLCYFVKVKMDNLMIRLFS